MPVFSDPLTEITDQVGVRVITYTHSDVAAVADLLADQLTVLDDRDMGQETASEGRFGYASRHLLVAVDPSTGQRAPSTRSATAARRCRCGPCSSTHGRSSSTTSATRARSPRSTPRTSTGASPSLPDCSSSPTRSSPRSATASKSSAGDTRTDDDATDPRISAPGPRDLPGRPVHRRRLVAHRPLRVDLRAAARARDHLARRAGRPAQLGRQRRDRRPDGLQVPRRRGPAARRRTARGLRGERYLALHGNAHREELLRARLEKLRAPAVSPLEE